MTEETSNHSIMVEVAYALPKQQLITAMHLRRIQQLRHAELGQRLGALGQSCYRPPKQQAAQPEAKGGLHG